MKNLIIDNSGSLNSSQKLTTASITLVFWGALFYMWQPLFSAIAWAFNIKLFYDHMIVLGGYAAFFSLTSIYVAVAGTMMMALYVWAKINQFRFRGKDKRKQMPEVSATKMASAFFVDEEELASWQDAKNVVIHLDDDGRITSVENNSP